MIKLFLGSGLLTFLLALPQEASAFGKKQPVEPPVETKPAPPPVAVQAIPFRYVNLAHVTTPAFFLPNGVRADFNADLDTILSTAINSSRYIRTQENTENSQSRLIITGGITNLELDILQLNMKIGWNKGGALPIGNIAGVQGEVDLKLSSLSVDFKIYDRQTGKVYSAAYTNEKLSKLSMNVHVNLDNIVASVDLLYKTALAETIRKATVDVMTAIENNKNFTYVPWETRVLGINRDRNTLVFEAGMADGVRVNEIYSIYSGCTAAESNTHDGCFERFLADVKVTNTGVLSAEAAPFSANDSLTQIWAGDKVYVKPLITTTAN